MNGLLRIEEHLQGKDETDVVGDDHVCSMSFLLVEHGPPANGMEKFGAFSCKEISWRERESGQGELTMLQARSLETD